jgi:hypothetical protein
VITSHKVVLQSYPTVVVVDGYFMKKGFIEALTTEGFQLATKGRRDADLKYPEESCVLYHDQYSGNGRPRQYSGMMNFQQIDKRRWR